MNVVVVAPHPDDEAIGCGGALLRHAADGDRVAVLFVTSGELGLPALAREEAWRIREREARAAAAVLGVGEWRFLRRPDWVLGDHLDVVVPDVASALDELGPDLVYVPHEGEWHPDHRAANAIVAAAMRRLGRPAAQVLTYEVWTPLGAFEEVRDITDHLDAKLRAVRCYGSQLGEFDYVRAVQGLAGYRGALAARTPYAEVFGRLAA